MTEPRWSPACRFLAAALLLTVGIALPATAAADECGCLPFATDSVSGELKQLTCSNLESNLRANLRFWANGQCGECGACFYSYTTVHPTCHMSDGFYVQAATQTYSCGVTGPPCPECA